MAEAPQKVRWLELGRYRRRRVAQAVRRGRVVDDPRDAPYAVGFADASLEWLSWNGRLTSQERNAIRARVEEQAGAKLARTLAGA